MSGSSSTHVVLRIADRPAEGVVRRFGPGVSAVPQWSGAAAPKPPTRRQRSAWGGVLLAFLAIAAVIAYLVLGRSDPLVLTGAAVAPAADLGQTCDVTVDVVGTIRTNGQAGAVRYRWIRCDGESTTLLSQSVESGQTEVKVPCSGR
jgi:hypothetical protein